MLVAKATTGLTFDAAGKLDVAPVLSASGQIAAGAEWYVDLAFLGAGSCCCTSRCGRSRGARPPRPRRSREPAFSATRRCPRRRYFAPDEGARHFAWVRSNQRLLELARRPAMMHIIRDTIEELRAGGADSIALREAALLKLYTDHWIERQVEGSEPAAVGSAAHTPRRQLLVGREIRARFSENLAVWMFANARSDVKSTELGELFVEWFPEEAERVASGGAPGAPGARPQLLQRAHLIEGIETDLRNCTFLSEDHKGGFAFAHKPFFEYFIAAAIDRCLREKRHLPGSLQARPWSTEISLHVADLWLLRRRGEPVTEDDTRWVFKVLTRRSARGNYARPVDDLHPTLEPPRPPYPSEGRPARWRRALARLLSLTSFFDAWAGSPQMRGLQVLLRGGVPYVWIERHLFSRVLGWLGGVAHSPRCLEPLELARARFDGAQLVGLDFSARSLVGASFSSASIDRCRFDRADLSDASFQDAALGWTSFMHSTLHRARFERATMGGCRFDRTDARDARFDWVVTSGSSMRFMSARRASLRDARLSGDLRGLDAIDADLTGTENFGDSITAARLPGGPPPTTELIPALLRHATSVSWSPDDTMLLALDRDSAWLLNAGRGAPLRRFLDPAGAILAAAFRSETELVTVSGAGATIHDLSGHERRGVRLDGTPHRVALDPSGTWLAAASGSSVLVARCDGEAKQWTASLGSEIRGLAVASDGQFFVASLGEEVWIAFADGSARLVTDSDLGSEVLIDPKRAWFAVVGGEASEIYLVSDFLHPASPASEVHGRVDRVYRRRPTASLSVRLVACSPDGAHVFGLRGADLVSWSCETWKEERSIVVPMIVMGTAAYAHTADELAVIGKYQIVVFDFAREGAVCTIVPFASDFYSMFQDSTRLTVSFADEETLLTAGLMGAHRWNLRELRSETPQRSQQSSIEPVIEEGVPSELVFGDPFSAMPEPGGTVIGTGPRRLAYLRHAEDREGGGVVEVYETDGRQMLVSIPVGSSAAHASFRGDVGALAYASGEHLIVFDLVEQRELVRSELPGISAVVHLPDGATVAAGDEAGRLHVLDVASGSKLKEIHTGGAKISAIVAAADSPVFLTAANGTLWSWMPGTDRVEIFSGPVPGTTDLVVSPDGRLLATVSRDDIVRVWSIADRKLVASLYHLSNGWAVVRADGKYRYGGEVWQLASSRGLCAYHLEDLDALIPDQRF